MSTTPAPGVDQLIAHARSAGLKQDEASIRTMIRERSIRSFKKLDAVIAELNGETKAKRNRQPAKINEIGARGFRFGDVYTASVKAAKGVATRAANLPKLLRLADEYGIRDKVEAAQKEGKDQAELCKIVAGAMG